MYTNKTIDLLNQTLMQFLRRWIRFLFGFSRRETNGFLILLPLMVLIIFSRSIHDVLTPSVQREFSQEARRLDSIVAILEKHGSLPKVQERDSLFPFDPNIASHDQLKSLGFRDQTATRLINYRSKGGKFLVRSDLLKIYGIDSGTYLRVYPLIQLPVDKEPVRLVHQDVEKSWEVKTDSLFDLNKADSFRLMKIYGIGPVLSSRIVRYREKLGGFVMKTQLFEVYGLDSVVIGRLSAASFISNSFEPRKLNINKLTEVELSGHPYLSKPEAAAIVAYRFQHGTFNEVGDIRKIHRIDEKTFLRIAPYLSIEKTARQH